LSVLLRFTDSDYPVGIFKLLLVMNDVTSGYVDGARFALPITRGRVT
jgi:hypothetical protein